MAQDITPQISTTGPLNNVSTLREWTRHEKGSPTPRMTHMSNKKMPYVATKICLKAEELAEYEDR